MRHDPRVLQIIDSLTAAGSEQSLVALAPHLVDEGVDLHVAYLVERDGLQADLARAGIPVISLANGRCDRRSWLSRTTDLLADLRPAVVHATLFEANLAGRRAAARRGVPCVSSLVNTAYGRTEVSGDGVRRVRVRAAQLADAVTARRVARFHAVTQHVASVMSRRLLIPPEKIEVIPRGRDPVVLGRRSPGRASAARRQLGVGDDVPLVLAVGRQEPQKGLDVLLRALPIVLSQLPDVQLVVAGREGRSTRALRDMVASFGLEDVVSFLGMRNDVPDLLAAADVFAFPSLWEGAGGTLIEAMALECPIVTSGLPTLLETVDESTAELVSPGSPGDLARGLVTVLAERPAAARRAHAARTRFDEHFTIQSSARRLAELYVRVISA